MVSCLIFKSLGHFEFLFVHGVRVCSNFIDLHTAVQLSQHHSWKRLHGPFCEPRQVWPCGFLWAHVDSASCTHS